MNKLQSITWPIVEGRETALSVSRVEPDQFPVHAAGVLDVMAVAYDRQHGDEGTGLLPDGAAFEVFDSSSRQAIESRVARMRDYAAKGAVYWAAYDTPYFEPGQNMTGVAKASPSRPGFRKFIGRPNCYVNDVASREARQGTGTGLLWALLDDYDPERVVVADVQRGSEGFFVASGLTARTDIEALELGSHRIPQVRFEAVAVKGVRAALQRNAPWLAEYIDHRII